MVTHVDPRAERRVTTLSPTPQAVSAARRFVTEAVESWGMAEVADLAALLSTELATNALLHARTSYEVVVERLGSPDAPRLRVTVLDDSPVDPVRRHHAVRSGTGRGIALVQTLARAWGSTAADALQGRAKGVWFELDLDTPRDTDEGAIFGEDWLAQVAEL